VVWETEAVDANLVVSFIRFRHELTLDEVGDLPREFALVRRLANPEPRGVRFDRPESFEDAFGRIGQSGGGRDVEQLQKERLEDHLAQAVPRDEIVPDHGADLLAHRVALKDAGDVLGRDADGVAA